MFQRTTKATRASVAFVAAGLAASTAPAQCTPTWSVDAAGFAQISDTTLRAVCSFDPDGGGPAPARIIYAGSRLLSVSSDENPVVEWTGTELRPVGTGLRGSVESLAVLNNELVAFGSLTLSGASSIPAAKWNGRDWTRMDTGLRSSLGIYATAYRGELVVTLPSSLPSNAVSRWNGATWTPLGPELLRAGSANTIHAANDELYFASDATLSKWDGSQWTPMGAFAAGFEGGRTIRTIAWYGGSLIVGGNFAFSPNGNYVGCLARLVADASGGHWESLGPAENSRCGALTILGPSLFAQISYGSGASAVNELRMWDGAAFSPLAYPAGMSGSPTSLQVVHDSVVVLGSGLLLNTEGPVSNFGTLRFGPGSPPQIARQPRDWFACRSTPSVTLSVVATGSLPFQYSWRRNGVPRADSSSSSISILHPDPSTVSGNTGFYDCTIANACGSVTSRAAEVRVCPADVVATGSSTCDAAVTLDDLLAFLDYFTRGDSRADIDNGTRTSTTDGGVTLDDLLYFLDRYQVGC